ncbi:DUF1488 family protein [Mesorhizobium sp. SB112]|uniref:DUF1488 domain-containing protein n=1 Tax=Mesorhizobium sp. SB112 TaxID=3151853 RepID=UPI0032656A85
MSLTFPNPSRSYDEAHKRIRFVGHDGMSQIEFALEVEALTAKSAKDAETGYLAAFDNALETIRDAARKAYNKSHQNRFVLTSSDLAR